MSRVTLELRCCSFCGLTEHQVEKLIAGPADIFICDECIETCMSLLLEGRIKQRTPDTEKKG